MSVDVAERIVTRIKHETRMSHGIIDSVGVVELFILIRKGRAVILRRPFGVPRLDHFFLLTAAVDRIVRVEQSARIGTTGAYGLTSTDRRWCSHKLLSNAWILG